jgi:hypothetical protein
VKIARIGTTRIPDRQKPSEPYHDDTGIELAMIILDVLSIPSNTN